MILLDTNVISEPWKPVPDGTVVAWMDAQTIETLFLSAITIAELRFGIAAMPLRKR
jgi:predicted nucleic acid-binding protein